MTVTVVMSTYNGEKYLREQIDSILRQENADIELFVRDDGSRDGTADILRDYAAHYDNFSFSLGENLGAGKSFCEALRNAPESDWYAFSDQDDVWLPERIDAGIKALEHYGCGRDPVPLLYTCRPVPVDADLRPVKVKEKYSAVTFGSSLLENRVSGCTFLFNGKARELLLRLPPEYISLHDWDMLRIVLAAGGKCYQDENGYVLYRQHGRNAVGADGSLGHRVRKLFKGGLLKDLRDRLRFAELLREKYADVIPAENRRIIDSLCDYKESFSSRMAVVRSEEIARTDRADDLFFKALFLLGLL